MCVAVSLGGSVGQGTTSRETSEHSPGDKSVLGEGADCGVRDSRSEIVDSPALIPD